MWNNGRLGYSELSNILPRIVQGEKFAKRTENFKVFGNLLDREVENLDNHVCPKVQDLVHGETWICSSYPFKHKTTLYCAERKAKLFRNWIMLHLML